MRAVPYFHCQSRAAGKLSTTIAYIPVSGGQILKISKALIFFGYGAVNMNSKKILICCQEVDTKSAMLGFFHNWIVELSKHYSQVTVVTLMAGAYTLPDNVKVLSLGKEAGDRGFFIRKVYYSLKFYYFILKNIHNYDSVFIHQDQEYALLGSLIWKIFGKKAFLWRNHYAGTFITRLACYVSHKTFYTSNSSYNATFSNAIKMPVGVDVESLKTTEVFSTPENSILVLSRLDPSKKPEIILQALRKLQDAQIVFTADFVGGASKSTSPNYEDKILKLKQDLCLGEKVKFIGAVSSTETYRYYLSHDIYINVSRSGMLDKTIFKALAAGCIPVTTSLDFNEMIQPVVDDEFKVQQDDVESLVEKLQHVLSLDTLLKQQKVKLMQDIAIEKNSLKTLVVKLIESI